MSESITVVIGKNGVVDVEANGFVGAGCKDKTKSLIDALTNGPVKDAVKAEFYDDANKQRERQGW